MPRYSQIRRYTAAERQRVLRRLLDLRSALDNSIATARPDTLLLATWNIRDFDSNRWAHGPRLRESFHYIAEIISRFDLVAVQEVNRDLGPLRRVMHLLGDDWSYMVTGVTEGISGNEERMAFLFNTSRIRFTNLSGQIVLPRSQLVVSGGGASAEGLQFARAPYIASFQAGWFRFNLCTVHIYFGGESGALLDRRVDEIGQIASHFRSLQQKEAADYILLGDFNIVSPQHRTMEALRRRGFVIPEALQNFRTNLGQNKFYDQIAFMPHQKQLEFGSAGVFDYRDAVFGDTDFDAYFDLMPADKRDFVGSGARRRPRTEQERRDYYNSQWITWQMSDHLLLWVELKVDFTTDYLTSLMPGREPLADDL